VQAPDEAGEAACAGEPRRGFLLSDREVDGVRARGPGAIPRSLPATGKRRKSAREGAHGMRGTAHQMPSVHGSSGFPNVTGTANHLACHPGHER
jgi:hypothetical protein